MVDHALPEKNAVSFIFITINAIYEEKSILNTNILRLDSNSVISKTFKNLFLRRLHFDKNVEETASLVCIMLPLY